ncbi:MAG: hypothetical protein IM607_18835, partial [Cytophagales bacterium]|nr:hypothetical protein [Cytophagales bacterium]
MQNNTDVTVQTDSPVEDRFTVETNVVPENVEPEKVEPSTEKTTEVETTDSEPDEEPTEKKSINPRTAQRKAEKERLIRENAVLAERLRQYEQEKATASDEPKARDLSKKPDIQDYDDVLEYTEDLATWKAGEIFESKTTQLNLQKQTEALAQRAEIVRAEKPDYDEKVSGLIESRLITPDIEREILSSPIGADVAYHLAEYGADLMTLRGLPAEALPKAIKAIEAFIKKGGEPQEKPKITKAEPPIAPPGVTVNADRPLSSYTQEEIENMPL